MENSILDAYFAGLLDGEGTIAVYPYKKATQLRPVVKLNMTCERTVRAIAAHFGGPVMVKKVMVGRKPQWHWIVTFNKAIHVAKRVRPYLITKTDGADAILNLAANR